VSKRLINDWIIKKSNGFLFLYNLYLHCVVEPNKTMEERAKNLALKRQHLDERRKLIATKYALLNEELSAEQIIKSGALEIIEEKKKQLAEKKRQVEDAKKKHEATLRALDVEKAEIDVYQDVVIKSIEEEVKSEFKGKNTPESAQEQQKKLIRKDNN